jgi:hypothetical protein
VLSSTGKLVGEGSDHPPLDTLRPGHADLVEGHAAAVRRPPPPRTCEQDPSAHHSTSSTPATPPFYACGTKRRSGYRSMGYQITGMDDFKALL